MIGAELKQCTAAVSTAQQFQTCSVHKTIQWQEETGTAEQEGLFLSRHDEAQCSRWKLAAIPRTLDFTAHHFNQEPGGYSPILGKFYRRPPWMAGRKKGSPMVWRDITHRRQPAKCVQTSVQPDMGDLGHSLISTLLHSSFCQGHKVDQGRLFSEPSVWQACKWQNIVASPAH